MNGRKSCQIFCVVLTWSHRSKEVGSSSPHFFPHYFLFKESGTIKCFRINFTECIFHQTKFVFTSSPLLIQHRSHTHQAPASFYLSRRRMLIWTNPGCVRSYDGAADCSCCSLVTTQLVGPRPTFYNQQICHRGQLQRQLCFPNFLCHFHRSAPVGSVCDRSAGWNKWFP